MRIHHLNCGCMCPIGGALFDGFSRGLTACLVCHCLLIETNQGLVLIDTGFGDRDIKAPLSRLSPFFMNLNRIQFEQKYTAIAQIEQLGLNPRDVRHIVLTHLDFDHAGGLEDFPDATVHVMQTEIEAAKSRHGFEEMGTTKPRCTPGLRAYQWLMEVDRKARLYNQERLRALSLDHSSEVQLFCSHDAIEFKAIALPNNS